MTRPIAAYLPEHLRRGGRSFGLAVQLYTLRSKRNWGIGDFTDLSNVMQLAGSRGIDLVGVNPLHALYLHKPDFPSPYSPSHRSFLNPLYIDVEQVAADLDLPMPKRLLHSTRFRSVLNKARETDWVDYGAVTALKIPLLRRLWDDFSKHENRHKHTYERFIADGGNTLEAFAVHEALANHFAKQDKWGWPVWPAAYRQPQSQAVKRFARQHVRDVGFHSFLQWQADQQLAAVQQAALRAGMRIGLYLDMAVGADRGGAEVWANAEHFNLGFSIGAPPDAMALDGQNWGLPPPRPDALLASNFAAFRANIAAVARRAGALRIDHCLGLQRLWWIPTDGACRDGRFVGYPLASLADGIGRESQAARCMVIGEDLGIVPRRLPKVMKRRDIASYKVLFFEQQSQGFRPLRQYPYISAATVTTHDLPTLASWWRGSDIDLRASLCLLGNVKTQDLHRQRTYSKQAIALAVENETGASLDTSVALNWRGCLQIHKYLARANSALMLTQLDDLQLLDAPVNVPGTHATYPNWQRKLPHSIDTFFSSRRFEHWARTLKKSRQDQASPST